MLHAEVRTMDRVLPTNEFTFLDSLCIVAVGNVIGEERSRLGRSYAPVAVECQGILVILHKIISLQFYRELLGTYNETAQLSFTSVLF